MKKFAKFFVVALVVTVIASVFMAVPSAAVADSATLTPGSDKVVFIMDAPEGEELEGNGLGTDPDNPLEPIDHEKFDPNATEPKYYLNTAFYQATELLKDTGGTVVIMGPITLGIKQAVGTQNPYVMTGDNGENTIKFTSVYNGVDYRKENNAKITLEAPANILVKGQYIWENIDIETSGSDRVIFCNKFPTLFADGVNCYPSDSSYEGVASGYISVSGGHRYEGGYSDEYSMTFRSGTYGNIISTIWGVTNGRWTKSTYNADDNTVAKLVIEGKTTVLGAIIGTTKQRAEFSGKTDIIINGGTLECDIYAVGITGMNNTDGVANITINGGDFRNCWSLAPTAPGFTNNAPASSILDLSGFKGDQMSLARAYAVATEAEIPFTTIKLPDGVTADQLLDLAAQTETDAPETGDNSNTDIGVVTNDANDGSDDTTKATGNNKVDVKDDGSNLGLIIGIVAGAVVVIAAVVVVIIMSKKKKSKDQ